MEQLQHIMANANHFIWVMCGFLLKQWIIPCIIHPIRVLLNFQNDQWWANAHHFTIKVITMKTLYFINDVYGIMGEKTHMVASNGDVLHVGDFVKVTNKTVRDNHSNTPFYDLVVKPTATPQREWHKHAFIMGWHGSCDEDVYQQEMLDLYDIEIVKKYNEYDNAKECDTRFNTVQHGRETND